HKVRVADEVTHERLPRRHVERLGAPVHRGQDGHVPVADGRGPHEHGQHARLQHEHGLRHYEQPPLGDPVGEGAGRHREEQHRRKLQARDQAELERRVGQLEHSQAWPTRCIQVPMSDTSWPLQNTRKSRWLSALKPAGSGIGGGSDRYSVTPVGAYSRPRASHVSRPATSPAVSWRPKSDLARATEPSFRIGVTTFRGASARPFLTIAERSTPTGERPTRTMRSENGEPTITAIATITHDERALLLRMPRRGSSDGVASPSASHSTARRSAA